MPVQADNQTDERPATGDTGLSKALPARRRWRRVVWLDCAALSLLGLLIALPLRGYFAKPANDFLELCEVGVALVHGQVPPTFKRAPVYPLVVGAGGVALRAIGVADPPPEQMAAEWLNVLLLPLNAVLVYLLGRRWCLTGAHATDAARWWAAWFVLVPWGVYCTAHLLLEPLLITTILGTVLLAGGRRRWPAYVAAAIATMTRYDAAGLVVGLAIADAWRTRRLRRPCLSAAVALLPLAIWLAFTALTWTTRSEEHYLQQIADELPRFDLAWAAQVVLDVCFKPERLVTPVWLGIAGVDLTPLIAAVRLLLTVAAIGGTVWLVVRRDASAIVAAVGAVGYIVVHARFPYQFPRFGYPLAPLLLLAAGAGLAAAWRWLGANAALKPLRTLVIVVVAVLVIALFYGELGSLSAAPFERAAWVPTVLLRVLVALVILWVAPMVWRLARFGRVGLLLGLLLLARVQLRETAPLLGTGREMAGLVDAARWIGRYTAPDDGVLCDQRGLFFLYAPDRRTERFISYDRIGAERWRDILAECRQRGVRYIVWHSAIVAGHLDKRDAARWRLARFTQLDDPEHVPGLSVVWSRRGSVSVWVLRLEAEAPSSGVSER